MKEVAYFAAGCFWHVQASFDKVAGVIETEAGYMGGDEKKFPNPNYQQIHQNETGYAETVKVIFDSKKVSYRELLDLFWKEHNPSTQNRQGFNIGSTYRAAVFYTSGEQKKIAEESKKEIEKKLTPQKVYTTIEKAGTFFRAEEYHQKYYQKTGIDSCPVKLFK